MSFVCKTQDPPAPSYGPDEPHKDTYQPSGSSYDVPKDPYPPAPTTYDHSSSGAYHVSPSYPPQNSYQPSSYAPQDTYAVDQPPAYSSSGGGESYRPPADAGSYPPSSDHYTPSSHGYKPSPPAKPYAPQDTYSSSDAYKPPSPSYYDGPVAYKQQSGGSKDGQ